MDRYDIYQQIAKRTNGDIYIGVVGPVRTGKSTFIKRFMDLLVIPNIDNTYEKDRALDELPQSAAGKTIMTTEPKFIPNEAVEITVGESINLKVRMVDCVGYLVKNALGYMENDAPRMVQTPWYDHKIPFGEAAEMGTRKVISEHSTIGVVVVTDGSITEIERNDYLEAEERVIAEMKKTGKPFVILLNSTAPVSAEAQTLRGELENTYGVPCLAINCAMLNTDDINAIMERVLYEFPICEIGINFPKWVESLDYNDKLKVSLITAVKEIFDPIEKLREIKARMSLFGDYSQISKASLEYINAGTGKALIDVRLQDSLFYSILSEKAGIEIEGEHKLIGLIKELAEIKKEYEKIECALTEVKTKGYGIVTPSINELTLEEPEIIKQGSRFGIKLRASAPSIHMIRADIETEIAPLVGSEKQSEELIQYLLGEFEGEPDKIWSSNIFGKSLYELMNEGLQNKLTKMPDEAQMKLQETLTRIINEGNGGLICIIL